MSHRSHTLGLVLAALLHPAVATAVVPDPHSAAEPDRVRSTHLELDLAVDLEARRIEGSVVHHLERVDPGAQHFVVDTRSLEIHGVEASTEQGWVEVVWDLGAEVPLLGRALRIDLPDGSDRVRIRYAAGPEATGLQWLTPRQTAGGRQPFMYSQGQAIHTRAWIPLQDTPGVRTTYEARITVRDPLVAVMAAEQLGADPASAGADRSYRFRMPQAIPSYLIAIAIGDLRFRAMSERTGIWTEAELLDASAWEFGDTEAMMRTVEAMYGDYDWGRYDLLVLPPSFPLGGMENPRLSYITPTVLAGDRSLVSLIAHELAHSWSGNLVTNSRWNDLWLNEGFTTYLTVRIMEALYGEARAAQEFLLDVQALEAEFEELDPALQWLSPEMSVEDDPEEAFTGTAYTKGMMMLAWLEHAVGRERFDAFLTEYFQTFAFQSLDTPRFLDYLEAELLADPAVRVTRAQVEAWVYGPGIPADAYRPESDAFETVSALQSEFLRGVLSPRDMVVDDWTVHQWLYFIESMPGDLGPARMRELDEAFEFTTQGNNEIVAAWLELAMQQGYRDADARLERFLTSVGRNKFLRPLYRALAATPEGLERARRIFERARPGYHPISVAAIEQVLADAASAQEEGA